MSYVTKYTKDEKTTKFVEQSDVMIDIAMTTKMSEVKDIVKQWRKDLKEVDYYRRANIDKSEDFA
jgi:hypothetical protein